MEMILIPIPNVLPTLSLKKDLCSEVEGPVLEGPVLVLDLEGPVLVFVGSLG